MKNSFCVSCGEKLTDDVQYCPKCGKCVGEYKTEATVSADSLRKEVPMKWYKFLVYFAILAGVVVNVCVGIVCLSGSHYEGAAEAVYAYYDNLQAIDIIYGVFCFGFSGYGVMVWRALRKMEASAPNMVCGLYTVSGVSSLVYILLVSLFTNVKLENSDYGRVILSLAFGIAMVWWNYEYFNKRKDLFVN